MPLKGTNLKPRAVARISFDAGWVQAENLLIWIATLMEESLLFTHAYHWNDPENYKSGDPRAGTCDWGIPQLNDGNTGGKRPLLVNDLPVPQPGGIKGQTEMLKFVEMATDPIRSIDHARDMYELRKFQPWAAYNSEAYLKHIDVASLAICNMFREQYGVPLL